MAYDGKVMRLALQRFEEDRQRRQAQYQERRERIFARQPRLREIDGELRSTMSRIITSALRHGTDPRSAVAVLRDENLSLQAEKRELLQKMGLPEDALEETPACALCGDTGYRNGRVCRCLRGYYAREQQKELSRMLDLGHQSFDTFSTDWYPDRYDPNIGVTVRQHMEMRLRRNGDGQVLPGVRRKEAGAGAVRQLALRMRRGEHRQILLRVRREAPRGSYQIQMQ